MSNTVITKQLLARNNSVFRSAFCCVLCSTQAGAAPVVDMVQVCRAGDSGGKGALDASISLDEAAHIISVLAIPLTPYIPVWEAPDLVQTATVPGLCYQLHLQHHQPSKLYSKVSTWSQP